MIAIFTPLIRTFTQTTMKTTNYSEIFWFVTLVLCTCVTLMRGQKLADQACEVTLPDNTIKYQTCISQPLSMTRVAPRFTLTVDPPTATCGTPRQRYCELGRPLCDFCDATIPQLAHPPDKMYDPEVPNAPTYWQSKAWDQWNYPNNMVVNITLSFGKTYFLEGDINIFFQSSRPIKMTLEKSMDNGVTWQVLQYYDRDCRPLYLTGVPRNVTAQNPAVVICSQEYSSIFPYVGGVVKLDILQGRYGLFKVNNILDSQALYQAMENEQVTQFLTFTDLRIRLLYPGTDAKEFSGNVENLRKYYYAISDIQIIGGCFCNLHARFCEVDTSNVLVCKCQHNTMGTNCEQCQPLYNNRPWKKGSYLPYPTGTANECEKCLCNDHAFSCTYSTVLGRGVCDNCTHNTTGTNCEKCAPSFFRNTSQPLNHPEVCLACNCEMLGVLNNNTNCAPVTVNGAVFGQCSCKQNVIGYRCDRCIDQYYGLLQMDNAPGVCKSCSCNLDGTTSQSNICEQLTGQCPCKPNTGSRICDQCKDGFYNFPHGQSFRDCLDCKCDKGGSFSLTCNKITGVCTCRPHVIGAKCNQMARGFYAPHIDVLELQPAVSTTSGTTTCKLTSDLQTQYNPFSGPQYAECTKGQKIFFELLSGNIMQPQLTWNYRIALRYSLNESFPWQSLKLEIGIVGSAVVNVPYYTARNNNTVFDPSCPIPVDNLAQSNIITNLQPGLGQSWMSGAAFSLDVRCVYSGILTVNDGANITSKILIDSLVIVPDPNSLVAFTASEGATLEGYNQCLQQILDLSTKGQALTNATCNRLIFEIGTQMRNGGTECSCNAIGTVPNTVCNVYGGQCQCKPGITGLQCDKCAPGFYNFTSAGCSACNCDPLGSTILVCDYATGQCPCLPNVAKFGENSTITASAGLQCRACRPNYFGFYTGNGCQPCNCNMDGSSGTQCTDQGQCPCKPTITGSHCDQCQDGNFKFSPAGCVSCNCTLAGSQNAKCGQIDGMCLCKKNVQGPKCDQCKLGTFNLDMQNPDGCQMCFCYGHSTTCSSASGFIKQQITAMQADVEKWPPPAGQPEYALAPAQFLGNRVSSYSQTLSVTYKSQTGGGPVVLDGHNIVFLEGSNGEMYMYPIAAGSNVIMTASAPRTVDLVLHESLWLVYIPQASSPTATTPQNPSYFKFYTLLSDIKSIRIQRIFNNVQTDVVSVSLTTAAPAPPTTPASQFVNFVENCTCTAARAVTGLSCELCAQGQQRSNTTGTISRFDTCKPCNCNQRTVTQPPVCDAITGECLNCKNGTLGFNCEQCAPNVLASSQCTLCEDSFWGLSKTGCQPCGCDAIGSVNTVCEQKTGKCQCAPNVAGRTCDQCADNFFNLRQTLGCQECDACYALVTTEMAILRSILANITEGVAHLAANDKNSELGSFSTRLNTALATMGSLIKFLSDATNVESAVTSEIARLNGTLQDLTSKLTVQAPATIAAANVSISQSRDRVNQSLAFISDASVTVKEAWLLISGSVNQHLVELKALATGVQNTLDRFNTQSNTALKDFFRQMEAVSAILNKTKEVTAKTASVLQLANEAQFIHRNNTDRLASLQTYVSKTNDLGISSTTAAEALLGNVTALRNMATAMLNMATTMTPVNENPVALQASAKQLKDKSDALLAAATTLVNNAAPVRQNIQVIQANESSLNARVAQAIADKSITFSQINQSYSELQQYKKTENETFTTAQNMLNIMQNFAAKSQEVETKANTSLQSVTQVRTQSEQAGQTAETLTTSLANTLQAADQANNTATQANNVAQQRTQDLSASNAKALNLRAESQKVLNDIDSKLQNITTTNTTQVLPANEQCQRLSAAVETFKTNADNTRIKVAESSQKVETTKASIQQAMALITSFRLLNATEIQKLKTDVQAAEARFGAQNLQVLIDALEKSISAQEEWLAKKKLELVEKQRTVTSMRGVINQFNP